MKVVLGLRGTRYFYTDKDGKKASFTLEPKALRGIMNDAMCMSNYELGIAEDHDGIIILDDGDPAPGTPLQDVLGDIVVELDVLPNMARCLSLLGIAREVAALTGGDGDGAEPRRTRRRRTTIDGKVNVEIENPKLCRAVLGDDHPQRHRRPVAAVDADAGCSTPGCGRSATPWTSPTTSCSSTASRCTPSTTTCS